MNDNFIMKPKVDFCFKELMEDAIVRKGLISAILGINPDEIKETKLLPTHLRKEHKDDKLGILDIKVLLNNNFQIDMEMQVTPYELWPERSLFYLSKMFSSQLKEGESYKELEKCIHIGILDFELFPEDEEYYSSFHFWEDSRRRLYSDKMNLRILELTKIEKRDYPETELLAWMRFMNAKNREEFQMLADNNEYINKAYDRLEKISADEQKRLEYEARQKAIRDHKAFMEDAEERGLARGMERGLQQGLHQGEIIGFIKTYQKLGYSFDKTLSVLMSDYQLSTEDSEKYMNEFWKICKK